MDEIKNNTFFFGNLDGELCVFFKNTKGEIYVAGAWECSISEADIAFLSVIEVPDEYKNIKKGYNG